MVVVVGGGGVGDDSGGVGVCSGDVDVGGGVVAGGAVADVGVDGVVGVTVEGVWWLWCGVANDGGGVGGVHTVGYGVVVAAAVVFMSPVVLLAPVMVSLL